MRYIVIYIFSDSRILMVNIHTKWLEPPQPIITTGCQQLQNPPRCTFQVINSKSPDRNSAKVVGWALPRLQPRKWWENDGKTLLDTDDTVQILGKSPCSGHGKMHMFLIAFGLLLYPLGCPYGTGLAILHKSCWLYMIYALYTYIYVPINLFVEYPYYTTKLGWCFIISSLDSLYTSPLADALYSL